MKKILYFFTGLLLTGLFTGCDVNEEFEGLDDLSKPTNVAAYTYTLTSTDYSTIGTKIQKPITDVIALYQDSLKTAIAAHNATDSTKFANAIAALKLDPVYLLGAEVKSSQYLTSSAPSETWVPLILATKFPYGDVASTAQVTYNYNLNNLGYLTAFKNATVYTVGSANYTSVGGKVSLLGAFTPSYPSSDFIPTFLKTAIAGASEGQIAVVTYKATTTEPSIDDIPVSITEFSDNFEGGNLNNFVNYNVTGIPVWAISTYGGTSFAKISGYVSGTGNVDNEDWLIIPSVDLSTAVTASISFSTAHKYAGNNLALKYSTDYDGSSAPSTATWSDLSFNFEAGTGTYAWTPSGNVSLPGMPNSNVSIAFVYTSTTTAASTWEVDNVVVSYKDLNSNIPIQTYKNCFKYTSSNWIETSKVVCVSPFEYEEMGILGGYFSSSILPAKFIPTYLRSKYPLAVEGDTSVVLYNYGSISTPKAEKYTFTSGAWSVYTGIQAKTDPFAFSTIGWVFDPTVNLDMVASDYQIMVDYVASDGSGLKNFADVPNNSEYYYGFSKKYSNVSFRLSYRNSYLQYDTELSALSSDVEKVNLLWDRLEEGMNIFLKLRFPDAVPQSSGVDVYYNIRVKIYTPDGLNTSITDTYVYRYRCIAAGTPPTFEFVSKTKI